ncbi:cytochrome c family protein [bacterium]|nr:cytochrome c family protein [bacterium]
MDRNFSPPGKHRIKNHYVSPFLAFLTGFSLLFLFGWIGFPELLYEKQPQPIAFNHKLHTKLADRGCESCHAFRSDGSFTGVPGIENCAPCHSTVENGRSDEVRLIQDFIEKREDIPWLVYARQPDSVFFSHAAHVKSGDLVCETCHGNIGESTTPLIYEKNILTGYSRQIWGQNMVLAAGTSFFAEVRSISAREMKMDDCVDCHETHELSGGSVQTNKQGCFICHK